LQDSLADVPVMPAEVNQVLLNMIVNATDAIGERYGENGSPQGKIVVRTSEVDSGVQIEIEDDGCGIPEGIQQRIFDPFFTTKDVGKGTGQGLAITYDVVVKRHGGRINVDSTPDVGTTFTIWFPYDELAGDNQVDEESLPVVAH
jgi:signal transduction histidine kinase